MSEVCTIYVITCDKSDKVYVGQTWLTFKERWDSGYGYKSNRHMWSAIKKYGKESFYYTVLTKCDNKNTADAIESFWIGVYGASNRELGYNIRHGGGGRGRVSGETKKLLSASQKGRPSSRKGKHHTEATKAILRERRMKQIIPTELASINKGKTWKVIDGKRVWLDTEKGEKL